MSKEKKEKTPLEEIVSERKSEIFHIRKGLRRETPQELALNHALIYINNPSADALLWIIHYLKQIPNT